ncbi:hypothetical protein B9479_003095 [Cryptococcus floricola]|uniref:Uncharacterized protein n=1 Tax=Cryptococcus floricola TaxID=2591691 RepID=A0A5D3B1R4_9TREE|nr:hypothetical protein B9479_003095 [Cryptococcus floricola]
MDTSKHPVEEIELPVYYTPSAPEALELTSITALAPVHHIIIDHLALVAPVTALLLSTYVYDITIPKLYRHVTASKSLLRGLESAEPGNRRKLDCLRHTETLKVEDMAAMWHQPSTAPELRTEEEDEVVGVPTGDLRRLDLYVSKGFPMIFLIMIACAGYTLPLLNITNATANITSDDGSSWAPANVSFGPSGGCMSYGDLPQKCFQTLNFKPDPLYLHLPANQTFTNGSSSQTLNRAFITNYIAAGWISIATIGLAVGFCYKRLSAIFRHLMIWGSVFTWVSFGLNVAIYLIFSIRADNNALGWDYHVGNGLWLFLYTVRIRGVGT